jgi:hypothetical protein
LTLPPVVARCHAPSVAVRPSSSHLPSGRDDGVFANAATSNCDYPPNISPLA